MSLLLGVFFLALVVVVGIAGRQVAEHLSIRSQDRREERAERSRLESERRERVLNMSKVELSQAVTDHEISTEEFLIHYPSARFR